MFDSKLHRYRRYIVTGGIATIIIAGVYAGATLKTEQQQKLAYQRAKDESREEKIARLERYLESLRKKKDELEEKIMEVEQRKARQVRIGELEKKRDAGRPVRITRSED